MKLTFVRYGGLSSVPQKGYDPSMPGSSSPPSRRGIYAFVAEAVEFFLLGGEEFDPRRMEWVRGEDGEKVLADSPEAVRITKDFELPRYFGRYARDGLRYLARHKKPKRFTHDGELWHHLPVARSQILREKGTWVLTTTLVYRLAFQKEFNRVKHAWRQCHPARLLDEFEVFIEKV